MEHLPPKPIHGFQFSSLLINALIFAGYIYLHEKIREWVIKRETFDLTNQEVNRICKKYLDSIDE